MAKKAKKKVSKKTAEPNVDIQISVDRKATGQALQLAITAIIMDRIAFKDAVKDILTNKEEISFVWDALETIYDRSNKFNKQLKEAMKFIRTNKTKANVELRAIKNLKLAKED